MAISASDPRSAAHIAAHSVRYQWSEQPIDPQAALRALTPEGALQRLLKGNLSQPQKQALADTIRAGFK